MGMHLEKFLLLLCLKGILFLFDSYTALTRLQEVKH